MQIQGNYVNSVGSSDAASEGVVTSKLIEARPTLRPAEVLEFIPGVIVTQHSGDGKANQYFLRGFNLDHGTDFATFVDGMPVNMPSHAHGQGYSDLNWLIPELVDRIAYRKGPYFAEDGDFSSAGSARIGLFDTLPRGVATVTLGQNGYARALVAHSDALASGHLLYALEAAHNDGPWVAPERFHRINGALRVSLDDGSTHQSLTAMAYSANWNATDQIPQRAIRSGVVSRFGAIDPTDGGDTARYSLSYRAARSDADASFKVDAYAIRSTLHLWSDFTYFLDHPIDLDPTSLAGDQFEQAERRTVVGLSANRTWNGTLGGRDTINTVGLQLRHDRLDPVGLYATVARQRESITQESRVRQTSLALYGENTLQWARWLRSIAGLRADRFSFGVDSSIASNSGSAQATLVSPKLSLIVGPWARTEFFVNHGHGFHSNDARGVTARVTPNEGLPVDGATPLVRSRGSEVGVRSELVPGLQSSFALWQLKLGSELVFAGDAGDTSASRPSRRRGIEWNNHVVASRWLLIDADVALSRARYTAFDPAGDFIPGSVDRVASLGLTLIDLGPWSGQFQLRHFGPRPLVEDNSQRSNATTLANARVGYRVTQDVRLALDVFNLFDRRASDIDYYYVSRLKGEPAGGVGDIHSHPVEPRSARITMTVRF
ncbi:MAG: TonB-dependent receptor [Caldimonas sp.]